MTRFPNLYTLLTGERLLTACERRLQEAERRVAEAEARGDDRATGRARMERTAAQHDRLREELGR